MATRLPLLPKNVVLVDKAGAATMTFTRWWQKFAEAIEAAITNITDVLVQLGLVQETADGALELAESAINPGGTIKDEKVLTDSLIADAVTSRYFTQIVSPVTLTNAVEVTILSLTVVKLLGDSEVDLDPCIRFASNDDVRGTISVYRDAAVIDSFVLFINGAGGTFRVSQTLPFTDSVGTPGTYNYSLRFTRNGGASSVTAEPGSCMRAKEFKR